MGIFNEDQITKTITDIDYFLTHSDKLKNELATTPIEDFVSIHSFESRICKIEHLCFELSKAQDAEAALLVINQIVALSSKNEILRRVILGAIRDWSAKPIDDARWKCAEEILNYNFINTPDEIIENGALTIYCKKIFSDLAAVNFALYHENVFCNFEDQQPFLTIKNILNLNEPYSEILKEAFRESIIENLTTQETHNVTDARSVVEGIKLLGDDFLKEFSEILDNVIALEPSEAADIFACAQVRGELLYELHRTISPSDSKIDFINDSIDRILESETNSSRARTTALLCFYAAKEKSLLNVVLTAFYNRQEVLLKVDSMVIAETLRLLTENEGFDKELSSHQCISFLIESFIKNEIKDHSPIFKHDIEVAQKFLFHLYSDVEEISPTLAHAGVNWLFKTFKAYQESDISDWNEIAALIAEKNEETFFACLLTSKKQNETAVLHALVAVFTNDFLYPSQFFVENAASFIKRSDTQAIDPADLESVQKRIKHLLFSDACVSSKEDSSIRF